nr:MAG TPA: hypothetical protein [Caudoviricetes sp.]
MLRTKSNEFQGMCIDGPSLCVFSDWFGFTGIAVRIYG